MKKIITSIILACAMCFPMMVEAATTCNGTTKTNYYFSHIAISAWDSLDAEGIGITIPTECRGKSLATCSGTIEYNTSDVAIFEDYKISEYNKNGLIIDEYPIKNVTSATEIDIDEYHDIWMDMLNDGKLVKTSGNKTYYIHTTNPEVFSQDKNWRTQNGQNNIYDSYVTNAAPSFKIKSIDFTPSYGYSNIYYGITDAFAFDPFERTFTITGTDIANCPSNVSDENNPTCIFPSVYVVEYCEPVEEYTITYNPNGGTGDVVPYSVKVTEGSNHSIINNNNVTKYTKEGHNFLGWSTDSAATSPTYTAGDTIELITSNKTLYAVWEKIGESVPTYKVYYYKNAEENEETNNYDPVKQGEDYKIKTGDIYTREGYKFLGWSTDKDATKADTEYDPGKVITVDKDLKLYAVWLNLGGGKNEEDQSRNGLGYSIGLIGTILAGTGAGVVYFKKRNRFENI